MASEVPVDPAVIRKTQDSLGKIIAKPPLTEKLLRKPPFAFLHDIITELNKKTQFLKGLYAPSELEAKGKWTKEEKLTFLAKVIDMLEFVIEDRISARPAKIAAGKEPSDTNKLLQLLANAVLTQKSSKDAIQKVHNGEKFTGKPKAKDGEKKREGDGEKRRSDRDQRERDSEKRKEDREEKKAAKSSEKKAGDEAASLKAEGEGLKEDHGAQRSTEMKLEDERDHSKDGGGSKPKTKTKTGKEKEHVEAREEGQSTMEPSPSMERPKHRPGTRRRAREPPPGDSGAGAVGGSGEDRGQVEVVQQHSSPSEEGSQIRLERTRLHSPDKLNDPSASSIRDAHQEELPQSEQGTWSSQAGPGGSTSAAGQSMPGSDLKRPTTSRRPPPKVVQRHVDEQDIRVSSGHDHPAPTVILDKGNEDEEEDEQFVVQDSASLHMQLPEESFAMGTDVTVNQKPEGVLTKTLLATKKHLEDVPTGLPDGEKVATISEAQRKKERELVRKEVERLQSSIQSLCQAANPLGKIMDYVQEDLDSMRHELEMWQSENSRHAEMLRREERVTEEELAPLQTQLTELDVKIKQQEDLICATKANILKNDERIQRLFVSMHLTT